MRLALIRHGTTAWNLEKRIQGRVDEPLCAAGRARLERLALPPTHRARRWYTSPLRRATETAVLLGLVETEIVPELVEMHWGEWEGEILKPLRRRLGAAMRDNEARGVDFRPPGGESPRQVQARLLRWLGRQAGIGEDIGAIVHRGIIRCAYALASGWDMCGESPVDLERDAIHEFEVDSGGKLLDRYRAIPLIERSAKY